MHFIIILSRVYRHLPPAYVWSKSAVAARQLSLPQLIWIE